MATRSNALSEIARFWLQECYGLFIRESIPVKLRYNNSDIDFAVTTPDIPITILNKITFKNAIIETKDERDFDPNGTDFTKRLLNDLSMMNEYFIDENKSGYCFSMLKEQHHKKAKEIFNGNDLIKIFIFHNIKLSDNSIIIPLADKKIYIVKSEEILDDIIKFFKTKYPGSGIRNSLIGDIFDMLIRYHKWMPIKTN